MKGSSVFWLTRRKMLVLRVKKFKQFLQKCAILYTKNCDVEWLDFFLLTEKKLEKCWVEIP